MRYIFPRQFGLHNVFTSIVDVNETVQPFKDYTFRDDELRQQARHSTNSDEKVPRRLRGKVLQLVSRLQRRHGRCAYKELLDHYCPTPVMLFPNPTTPFPLVYVSFIDMLIDPSRPQARQRRSRTVGSRSMARWR